MFSNLSAYTPRMLSVLRIVTAFLFMQHGTAKFFGFPHVAMFDKFQPMSLAGAAGALEIVGGALVLIGLFTRPVAFVLSGLMAVAYFIAHAPQGGFLTPILNGGELAIMYSYVFLLFFFADPGPWSVDAARKAA